MGNFIWKLGSWESVYNREDWSHIHNGVSIKLIQLALADESSLWRENFWITKHFGKTIGMNACIETTENDECDIFYGIRKGRYGYTRFIRNRVAKASDELTIFLKRSWVWNDFTLLTAFVGPIAELEPTDMTIAFTGELLEKSLTFWKSHALIPENESYDPATETTKIPEVYLTKY